MKISVVIPVKNEEKNIGRCLDSLSFCDEVLLIDDYSTDSTVKIAKKKRGVKVLQRHLQRDFAAQRNYGLKEAKGEWVLFVDADEQVDGELASEIVNATGRGGESDSYYLKRRDFFWGSELKFGETATARNKGIIRLVRKDSGNWTGDVHEIYHTAKKPGSLKGFLNHYPHQKVVEFLKDINFYSSLRAAELFDRGKKTNIVEIALLPALKFLKGYVFDLGFLDGAAGFTYCFLMSFHSYLVRSKLYMLHLNAS